MNAKPLIPALLLALAAGAAAAALVRNAANSDPTADCASRDAHAPIPRIQIVANPTPGAAPDSVPRIVVIGRRADGAQALAAARP